MAAYDIHLSEQTHTTDTCYTGMLVWIKIEILIALTSRQSHSKNYNLFIPTNIQLNPPSQSSVAQWHRKLWYNHICNLPLSSINRQEDSAVYNGFEQTTWNKNFEGTNFKFRTEKLCSTPCCLSICYHFVILILNITEGCKKTDNNFNTKCFEVLRQKINLVIFYNHLATAINIKSLC